VRGDRIGWLGGLTVETKDCRLLLDPVPGRSVGRDTNVFISHAHADHTYGFTLDATKYATAPTRQTYESLSQRHVRDCKEVALKSKFKLDGVEIVPLNAGHMLGSAQFKIFTNEQTILYTGDLNCLDTLTTQAAEQTDCDLLVIEATYGDPSYIFPRRERTYARIVQWTLNQIRGGKIPVFHVYSAGKAQELVRLFNLYTNVRVLCSRSISKVNRTYCENGLKLCYESLVDSNVIRDARTDPSVILTTTSRDWSTSGHVSHALATGWALRIHSPGPTSFPLSSHADFKQLLEFIRGTKAKMVYTFGGFPDTFPNYVKKRLHIEAKPIPLLMQTRLLDYSG
jgi:putative mRNA 3-end processing factor